MLYFCVITNHSVRMSFLEKLLLGLVGAEFIEDVEHLHEQHIQEQEQHRLDALFWQDAARRNPSINDDDLDDW